MDAGSQANLIKIFVKYSVVVFKEIETKWYLFWIFVAEDFYQALLSLDLFVFHFEDGNITISWHKIKKIVNDELEIWKHADVFIRTVTDCVVTYVTLNAFNFSDVV